MIPMTAALAAKIDELEQLARSRTDAMQISRDQGELLAAAALAHRAKFIVEIGTSYGFSGLWWSAALAVTNGYLHTIDVSEKKYASAKSTFAEAGVSDRVISYHADGHDVLANLANGIDIAFIDADKSSTQDYFDLLWPKLRVGGAVLTDNVLSHKREMGEYIARLRQRKDAHSTTIPIRAGLEWTVKLA